VKKLADGAARQGFQCVEEVASVSGRNRLPSGGPRKASQRRTRRTEARTIQIEITWKPGDRVKWRDRVGLYRRDVDDEHGEVVLDERLYRVRKSELRPG
jgi:hypothetical protein